MLDLRTIDDLARRLGESLPPGLAQRKEELEGRFRTILAGALERMNLVSREEFDARCVQLEAAREQLAELERRLDELEDR